MFDHTPGILLVLSRYTVEMVTRLSHSIGVTTQPAEGQLVLRLPTMAGIDMVDTMVVR